MTEYLNLGRIVNTHGIKGEVRVQSITLQAKERYQPGAELIIQHSAGQLEKVTVETHRQHKNFDLLSFKEFDNIDEVEGLKEKMLQIDRKNLPPLEEGHYYESDLLDLEVLTEDREKVGYIKEILFLPANDVWVVGRLGKKDLLLPVIPSVILSVDLKAKEIIVNILKGLDPDED